jgi:hypothetical protein
MGRSGRYDRPIQLITVGLRSRVISFNPEGKKQPDNFLLHKSCDLRIKPIGYLIVGIIQFTNNLTRN